MPISVNTGVRVEVMLIQTLETGRGGGVALRTGVKILLLIGGCA